MAKETISLKGDFMDTFMKELRGFQFSQVIITAVDVGIFDYLFNEKKATSSQICSALQLDYNCTTRLMRMCVNLQLLRAEMTSNTEIFENTPETDQYLVRSSEDSIVDLVTEYRLFYTEMERLPLAVKHGLSASAPSDHLAGDNLVEKRIDFNSCQMIQAAPAIATAVDLSQYKVVYDLAGGTGVLARELQKVYPNMNVTVMEQKGIIHYATSVKGITDVKFVEGDMFGDLPKADLFIQGHISVFLNQEELLNMYRRIHSALNPGGAYLVCETILDADRCGPTHVLLRDTLAMVSTGHGERTEADYRDILDKAGFSHIHTHVCQPFVGYDVLLARK